MSYGLAALFVRAKTKRDDPNRKSFRALSIQKCADSAFKWKKIDHVPINPELTLFYPFSPVDAHNIPCYPIFARSDWGNGGEAPSWNPLRPLETSCLSSDPMIQQNAAAAWGAAPTANRVFVLQPKGE